MVDRVTDWIRRAQAGDAASREYLLRTYRSFVRAVASGVCGRRLSWHHDDDELSIALIAFNEAIDRYEPERSGDFQRFARLVITSRLRDYLRREARHRHLSLVLVTDEGDELVPLEHAESVRRHEEGLTARDLAEEIATLDRLLAEYGFDLTVLADRAPQHRETRDQCLRVALAVIRDPHLLEMLRRRRMLPIGELERITGLSRKVLETWRRYIVALVLIGSTPELAGLRRFLGLPEPASREDGRRDMRGLLHR